MLVKYFCFAEFWTELFELVLWVGVECVRDMTAHIECIQLQKSSIATTMHSSFAAVSWEELRPVSFKETIYLPSLKVSITAGSFILYRTGSQSSSVATTGLASTVVDRDSNNIDNGFTSAQLRLVDDGVLESVG
jgi:hypothetical protein